jgi:hypothetical protein
MQMILTIVAGTFGGKYLDRYLSLSFPVFTLIGVLLSVFGSVWMAIREFLKK